MNLKTPRAIDLYSGIGGWSLGLTMAGIDVVASYEWWDIANKTNLKNNNHTATEVDIRQLKLETLPTDIDIVVGSPPCTQFSFANRGGGGDIEDGLKDIAKFLTVVDFIKPKFWAMENVPRVAKILDMELKKGGRLEYFSHLNPTIQVIDTCEWGIPQRRKRCIAGNFDFNLLNEYKKNTIPKTLGDVVFALSKSKIIDPIYNITLDKDHLIDHEIEDFLNKEEERMNREMKIFHPVYNNMAFPDPLNKTARTITATCTRVSRESVVIEAPEMSNRFRRLTIRERACLQGFPINYQFFGKSYSQKIKMIGNAVPPAFTFYVAQAILNISPANVITPSYGINRFVPTTDLPPVTKPDSAGEKYTKKRRFRAAIPNLRFKSGVRFELSNSFDELDNVKWAVRFFFGDSKNIKELSLDHYMEYVFKKNEGISSIYKLISTPLAHIETAITSTTAQRLQDVWIHKSEYGIHPYDIVDVLGQASSDVIVQLSKIDDLSKNTLTNVLNELHNPKGKSKLLEYPEAVVAGLIIGSYANKLFFNA